MSKEGGVVVLKGSEELWPGIQGCINLHVSFNQICLLHSQEIFCLKDN